MKVKNYYHILEIDPFASQEEVKRAYLAKLKAYHPDKKNGHNSFAYKRFQAVIEAYEALKTQERRASYDKVLMVELSLQQEQHKAAQAASKPKNDNSSRKSKSLFNWFKGPQEKRAETK